MAEATTEPAPVPAAAPPRAPAPARGLNRDEVLMVAGGALILVDLAFFVLGRFYYHDKLEGFYDAQDILDPQAAASAAAWASCMATFFWSFFTFSLITIVAITAAVLWPRPVAHGLATLFGTLFLVGAVFVLFRSHMPTLVGIFQAALGALILRLTYASYRARDRAAWAFLFAIAGVLTVFLLFGTPRIRAAIHVERLWFVMLIPGVMAALATGLYRIRNDYDSR
jgi:cytochrome bd-type quinol oxidase subunit 2